MYEPGSPPIFLMNCPIKTTARFVGAVQQIELPTAISRQPTTVTFLFPNFFAKGHTAKIPIPIGMPPITDTSICVTPSLYFPKTQLQ